MVNNKVPMNHQQHLQSNGVTLEKIKVTTAVSNGLGQKQHSPQQQQHQEDEILEVNLIGTRAVAPDQPDSTPDNLLGDFSEFLDSGQFTDIVLRCSDGRFVECHRLVLAARARNLGHFMSGRTCPLTELVFRNCVKFEHMQALVNLLYRGHINGQQHQITSTLWKLFKIFGVRVTAKCFRGLKTGQKELAHQLKHDTVEKDMQRGAAKFEKIVQEFRSETRRKSRRPKGSGSGATESDHQGQAKTNGVTLSPKKRNERQPGVIVISDDDWSSASCSSSVSSLSSSSSEAEPQMDISKSKNVVIAVKGKQQSNGKSNSAMTAVARKEKIIITEPTMPTLRIKDIRSGPQVVADNDYESSGSSEGEYVENYKPAPAKKKKRMPVLTAPSCLEYNQNEMSIVIKSHGPTKESATALPLQSVNETTPKKLDDHSPFKNTESESIICSPQILLNIKPEPIDSDVEEDHDMGLIEEVDMEHFGIKMEIVEDETEEHMLAQDRHGRRLPPPLLIPLNQNRQTRNKLEDLDEPSDYLNCPKLEELIKSSKPGCPPPANFPPFVLRNPRGNQTRTYTTDNLWAALMDVKSGESIYRASQQHKVPRKTLRNWMKRCHIKSSYPMPTQLKDAAEKRKRQTHPIYYQ